MRLNLAKAEAVTIDGIKWIPFLELREGWVMRPWCQTRYSLFHWNSLSALWIERRLHIEADCSTDGSVAELETVSDAVPDRGPVKFALVAEKDRQEALRRLRYVSAVADLQGGKFDGAPGLIPSSRFFQAVAYDVSKCIEPNGDADAPNGRTVREWYRRWLAAGFNVTALLPARDARKRKPLHS